MIWQMGQAFDSLFGNLRDLGADDWLWVPPGGVRSIRAIVGHVASCKVMYDNHAFGDASMTWMDAPFGEAQSPSAEGGMTAAALVEWLRGSERQLRTNFDALADDEELMKPRPVNWGGTRPTRWIVNTLIQHDGFHAGEINHLRAVHQQNDRWEWEQ
jgi:hypothetical protein